VFGQFLYESGRDDRGSHQAGSINWFMGMARRKFRRRPARTPRQESRTEDRNAEGEESSNLFLM
jgi:hypothetical protein